MKTLTEIQNQLSAYKPYLFENYPLKSIAIFGSYARNENDEKSDLDLMVEFNGKIGIQFIDLADGIEEFMGMKIDLVSKNGIKKKYYSAIKRDLIYV